MRFLEDIFFVILEFLGFEAAKRVISGFGLESIMLIPLLIFVVGICTFWTSDVSISIVRGLFNLRDEHPINIVISVAWLILFSSGAIWIIMDDFS